jgi:hypothetical protein
MKSMIERTKALAYAIAFKHENPEEKATTAARIYHVSDSALRSALQVERQRGGHNKVLSDAQIKTIYKYVKVSYLSGYGATKAMVYVAVSCPKSNELPPKKPLTWRWFQIFVKAHLELFRTLKTKAIARVRVTAADVEEVRAWFDGFWM